MCVLVSGSRSQLLIVRELFCCLSFCSSIFQLNRVFWKENHEIFIILMNKLAYFLAIMLATLYGSVVLADEIQISQGTGLESGSMLDGLLGNYMGVDQIWSYLISLFVAIILSVIIAYHPQTFGRKENLSDIEAPKTLIFYGLIGSLVGATVADYGSELGFIFFGLGGLMRFRSSSGSTAQTGRLILVALIGLCCGLKMLYIAAISTIVAWILIYILERKVIHQLDIKKIKDKVFSESVVAYRQALRKQNCNIIIETKNSSKSKVSFIFSSPSKLHREDIETFFDRHIADDNRGVLDWNV